MANYSTTSGFSDLIGSMVVTGSNVDSYTSNAQGAGTVQNLGGSGLDFNVRFPAVNRTYHIDATANGTGYSGDANNNGPEAAEESWSATASTAETLAASAGSDEASKIAAN